MSPTPSHGLHRRSWGQMLHPHIFFSSVPSLDAAGCSLAACFHEDWILLQPGRKSLAGPASSCELPPTTSWTLAFFLPSPFRAASSAPRDSRLSQVQGQAHLGPNTCPCCLKLMTDGCAPQGMGPSKESSAVPSWLDHARSAALGRVTLLSELHRFCQHLVTTAISVPVAFLFITLLLVCEQPPSGEGAWPLRLATKD